MDEMRLDDELKAAINVDPSPEFLARVRTRIASEPAPARWRLAWVMVPIVTASVALFGVIAPRPERPAIQTMTTDSPLVVQVKPDATITSPDAATTPPDATPVLRSVRLQPGKTIDLPQVIVSLDEQRALEFVETIVSGGRVADMTVEQPPTDIEPVTLRDVEIVPITGLERVRVEPLQITRLETGELQ